MGSPPKKRLSRSLGLENKRNNNAATRHDSSSMSNSNGNGSSNGNQSSQNDQSNQSSRKSNSSSASTSAGTEGERAAPAMMPPPPITADIKVDPVEAARRSAAARAYALQGSSPSQKQKQKQKQKQRQTQKSKSNSKFSKTASTATNHTKTPPPSVSVYNYSPMNNPNLMDPSRTSDPVATTCTNSSSNATSTSKRKNISSSTSSSRKKSRPSLPPATNLYYNHTMAYNRTTYNHTINHTAGIIKRPQKNPPSQPNTATFRTAPPWGGRRGTRKNSKTNTGSTINHVTTAATTLYSTVSPAPAADEGSDDCDLDENDLEYAKFVRSLITTTKPTTSITNNHYPTFPLHNSEHNTILCNEVNNAIISTPSSTTSLMKNANNTLNKLNPDIPGNSNGIEEEDDDEDEEEYKGDDDDDEEEDDEYDELDTLHLEPLGDTSNGSSENDKNCTNFSSSGAASITPDSDVPLSYQGQNEMQQQTLTRTPKEENKAVNEDRDNDNNSLDQAIHWLGNEDPNSDAFHAALEAELGSLLEEDLEAAVSTLVYGHGQPDVGSSSGSIGEIGDVVGGLGVASTTSAVMGTPKKEIQMTVGSGNNSNTSTIVSGIVGNGSEKNNTNGVTSTPSSSPKLHGSCTSLHSGGTMASTESPTTTASATNNNVSSSSSLGAVQQPPTPTEDQIAQLQTLMSQHYQILLQQAILAIRAAHGNKLQKENPAAAAAANLSGGSSSELSGVSSSPGDRKKIAMHGKDQVPSSGINSVCHWPRNDFFFGAESADDLAEIIDGAVGMLQDLDQNRKDAIRYDIQMQRAKKRKDMVRAGTSDSIGGRKLLPPCAPSSARSLHKCRNKSMKLNEDHVDDESGGGRMLTRSAFSRTLREREMEEGVSGTSGIKNDEHDRPDSLVRFHGSSNSSGGVLVGSALNNTTFGVKGLARLNETFSAIDSSVNASSSIGGAATETTPDTSIGGSVVNILNPLQHDDACKQLLQHARAEYNESLLPCRRNLSHILSYPGEVTGGSDSSLDLNKDQEIQLRKNRNQFTAAEDNLLLRGVNLYGEKEWLLISDRFLPDRSVSIISQRYARICLLIYKANGIKVDEDGCLETPPEHPNGAEDFDEVAISKLRPVETPASYNVHRWSLEEDITLLKAVPLMGHMWAEVAARLIPHRNRGHIRKRYQVLERRVKATVRREKKILAEQSRIKASMKAKADKNSYSAGTISKKEINRKTIPETIPPAKLLPVPAYAKNITHGFATHQARSQMTKVGYVHPFIPASMYMPPSQAVLAQTQRPALAKVSSVIGRPHALQIATRSAKNGITKNGNTSDTKKIPMKQILDQKGNTSDKTLLCSEKIGSLANESGKQQEGKDGTKPTGISSTAQASTKTSSALAFPSSLPAPINDTPPVVENTNPASLSGCSKNMDVSNTADTSTRMGFEKILDGEGWSNMSSVRKLIDGNESSTVKFKVDTSNNETKSKQVILHPGKDMERLPNLSLDNSCSGLSMLNTSDYSSSQTEAKSGSEIITKKTQSIMSSVLSRAKENLPKKNEESLLKGNYQSSVDPYGSSMKHTSYFRNSPNAASLSSFPVPDTPRGDGMTQGMIPGPITMMASNGAGYSMDGFNFSNFSLTEESRQALDGALPRSSMTPGIGFSQSFQHIHSGAYIPNSLMEPTDLEAIDVLNQMSNSSAPFPKSSPTSKVMQKSSCNDKEKTLGDTGISSKTSLLTKVFGSIQDKGAKKK